MDGKPFRVTNTSGDGPYGVVASNLKELVQEGCDKLKLSEDGCRVCLFEDGTEVDERYFLALDRNCKLVILQKGQEWKGEMFNIFDKFVETFYEDNDALATLTNEVSSPKKRKFLENFIPICQENISAEKREEDPRWFEDLNKRFKTKSQYMKSICGQRMRNYLPKDFEKEKEIEIKDKLKEMLKGNNHNESYFDRTDEQKCICDSSGLFTCQGPFDKQTCGSEHSINPYRCKEHRIMFRIWNFDHKKERSVIISNIINAAENMENNNTKVNDTEVLQFYEELFTMKNLKFVYIVCHELTKHNIP